MTAPDRLRDLADVQEPIRAADLDASFAARIDPSVRDKFLELVATVRAAERALDDRDLVLATRSQVDE